jgi:hypothetical protein
LAAVVLQTGCFGLNEDHFELSGKITVPARLQKRTEAYNTVLFVVASNAAGVPIAVARIVNPQFPLAYQMKTENLVLPGPVWKGKLSVKACINAHGKVGVIERGDLVGTHPGQVYSGTRGVNIVIDRET